MGKKDKSLADAKALAHPSSAPVKRFASRSLDQIMAQLLKGGSTKPVPNSAQKWLQRNDTNLLPAANREAVADSENIEPFTILSDDHDLSEGLERHLLSAFSVSSLAELRFSYIRMREIIEACTIFQADSLLEGGAFDFRIVREEFGFRSTKTSIEAYKVNENLPVWRYNEINNRNVDEYYSLIPDEYRDDLLRDVPSGDLVTEAVRCALEKVGLGQEHAKPLTAALVAELSERKLAVAPAVPHLALVPQTLPTEAPEIYAGVRSGETPADFIKRVYAPWVGNGLTKTGLRQLDPGLYRALYNWLGRGNVLPDDLPLPTRQEVNDKLVEGFIESSGKPLNEVLAEARRIESAARYRLKEK